MDIFYFKFLWLYCKKIETKEAKQYPTEQLKDHWRNQGGNNNQIQIENNNNNISNNERERNNVPQEERNLIDANATGDLTNTRIEVKNESDI